MNDSTLNLIAGISASVGTIIGTWFLIARLVVPLFKRTQKLFDTWESFIRDWSGEEASPGRDRVPGVMERLNAMDGELKHNGGSSIKDSVSRIESTVNKINERLADGDNQFQRIDQELEAIKKKLKA